jgi:pentapeptide MXKDX repeat protein
LSGVDSSEVDPQRDAPLHPRGNRFLPRLRSKQPSDLEGIMRRLSFGVSCAALVACVGLGIAGCGSSETPAGGKMATEKMTTDKMGSDKMSSDKMSSDKMGTGKMGSDKMGSDKMGSDKMESGK